RETIPSTGREYDDRPRDSASQAEEGTTRAVGVAKDVGTVRGAACALGLLLSRRSFAAGRACGPRGGARLRSACADRSRRALRLARVRACGETLRRASDHRSGGNARRRVARDVARRGRARLRKSLPPPYGSARTHSTA